MAFRADYPTCTVSPFSDCLSTGIRSPKWPKGSGASRLVETLAEALPTTDQGIRTPNPAATSSSKRASGPPRVTVRGARLASVPRFLELVFKVPGSQHHLLTVVTAQILHAKDGD